MAEGFAEAFGQGRLEVYSAGSLPSAEIDPLVIEVMKEKGIDLSSKKPKGLNDLPPVEMDYLDDDGMRGRPARRSRQKKSSSGRSPIQKESPLMKSEGSGI